MNTVEAEPVKGSSSSSSSVAPPEPISPARSAMSAPTSVPANNANGSANANASATAAKPQMPAPTASKPSPPPPPPPSQSAPATATATTTAGSVSSVLAAPRDAPESVAAVAATVPALSSTTGAGTGTGAGAGAGPGAAPGPGESVIPLRGDNTTPPKPVNGNAHKASIDEGEAESELSDPASSVHSPSGVGFNELEDEIVVSSKSNAPRRTLASRHPDKEDEAMPDAPDEPVTSHYPKRKRTQLFNDLSESKIEIPTSVQDDKSTPPASGRPRAPRQSLSSVKGVIVGYWRDSPSPEEKNKHAVIGFIDVRDRLRTRIQPITTAGEPVPGDYPLPPGPGGSWVTFERIVFSAHLIGLDHYQIKEYVRLRSDTYEETDAARKAAEKEAVKEAIRRAKENASLEPSSTANPPLIAYGLEIPDPNNAASRQDSKRRRTSGGFSAVNNSEPSNGIAQQAQSNAQPQAIAAHPQHPRTTIDPLPGTRPTRILLGYWKLSSEHHARDRHAVYGILGQNDMFRVKLVRETRDGRFVDGNFPVGAGALWIAYEEVEFEDHLKPLTRLEVKEYCRIRQWQMDHGEVLEDRVGNETKAVFDAQARAAAGVGAGFKAASPPRPPFANIAPNPNTEDVSNQNANAPVIRPAGFGGHELRQSRRVEARAERPIRQGPVPAQGGDAVERTNSLARREIARIETAQGRADRHAAHRERAAAAAAEAAAAAAAAVNPAPPMTNGRALHESEDMQRLNKVWARQETLRMKAGAEDAKMYGGIKYERKGTGPFMGKLVSQGTILNIDGEDYVEYRVLTKPSFF